MQAANGKLAVMCVGLGAVTTTFITGTLMYRKGLSIPGGSVIEMAKIRVGRGASKQYKKINDRLFITIMSLQTLFIFLTYDGFF